MNKTYLITGGMGFIGQSVANLLLKLNNKVIILDNNFRNKDIKLVNKNITYLKYDIRNLTKLMNIRKKIDSVIHLAFINGTNYFYEKPELVLDVGVKGILNILDFCKNKKIKEIFLASSSEVYQDPPYFPTDEKVPLSIPNPHDPRYSYSSGKIISEILILNSTIFKKAIIFRPHNIYGPNMGYNHVIPELIMKFKNSKEFINIQGNGKNTRSFCYIDDFVKGFNCILEKGRHLNIYNIGNNHEISINELTKLIKKKMNSKAKILKSGNLNNKNAVRRLPDLKKIKKIGYSPSISLDIGLDKTIQWYKKN